MIILRKLDYSPNGNFMDTLFIPAIHLSIAAQYFGNLCLRSICINPQTF